MTGAHGDFLAAWDKVSGLETAKKLIKAAVDKALGYPVIEKTFDRNGKIIKEVQRQEHDFGPLHGILPYIARKMPDRVELGPVESMDPSEVDKIWGTCQSLAAKRAKS